MARRYKYAPLESYLMRAGSKIDTVSLSFKQIEEIIGAKLPPSAYEYREWWSNQSDVSNRPQAKSWIRAGFHVQELNQSMESGWVRWVRVNRPNDDCAPVADPLKPLDQVLTPDQRSEMATIYEHGTFRKKTLEDHYRDVEKINLSGSVPNGVRQLFETAKNLVLYTWFVYRFHQPAELCAYGALEMALRQKAKGGDSVWWNKVTSVNKDGGLRLPSMRELFIKAIESGWVNNEGFSVWWDHQQHRAYDKAINKIMEKMAREKLNEIETPAYEEFKGVVADESYDYVKILSKTIPSLRNSLAHGASSLHPHSLGTLALCAEVINELFPSRAARVGSA